MTCKLSNDILSSNTKLKILIDSISPERSTLKIIEGTGGLVSIDNIIAYQIGWGNLLIGWYEAGINNITTEMPGNGFTRWDCVAIAQHFYNKYQSYLDNKFDNVVLNIIEIVEQEHHSGNLYKTGVWPWCKLNSGKEWSLSKWITVNTVSPYKRAYNLIKSDYPT
jgi:hypothetical protein